MLIPLALGLIILVIGLALGARSLPRPALERFARRQGLLVTPYNGDHVIAYLRAVRSWRGAGLLGGIAFSLYFLGNLNFLFLLYGWLAGVLVAEFQLAATRPRRRDGRRLELVPRAHMVLWWLVALACWAMAGVSVVRSFTGEVGVAERFFLAIPPVVALAVHLVLRDLSGRAVPAGTMDLVAAEFAARRTSARVLLAGGGAVTFLTTGVLLVGVLPAPAPPPLTIELGPLPSIRFAVVQPDQDRWEMWTERGQPMPLSAADPSGPFAASGDGAHVIYRDRGTGRLVYRGPNREGAAELPGRGEIVFSRDGRHAAIGTSLVDTETGAAVTVNAARIIGIGGDRVVGTAGPRALPGTPASEVLVFDLRGALLSRAPLDPSLDVRLTPDGTKLAVLTFDDIVSMDPATGEVLGRKRLKLPPRTADQASLGWSADGRLLIKAEPGSADGPGHYLVDVRTGAAEALEEMPEPRAGLVYGSVT
ncbi:hypothetical protein [Nonomuraea typhae]|uniref:Uncharacterized protein n=1 Tax=Nonomuraea typhae TaxID=2603600 RepID=A0ABW7Z3P9_9ACTN